MGRKSLSTAISPNSTAARAANTPIISLRRDGFRATKPGELHAEINEAFNVDGPAIVDCVVAADEMPNFPHLELDKLRNYAVAKIKEAILAVTGS